MKGSVRDILICFCSCYRDCGCDYEGDMHKLKELLHLRKHRRNVTWHYASALRRRQRLSAWPALTRCTVFGGQRLRHKSRKVWYKAHASEGPVCFLRLSDLSILQNQVCSCNRVSCTSHL